jgi:patatin-like phospholipase/acyl hydrolase
MGRDPTHAGDHRPFRVLSLDGGGIMGAFAASVLATFERDTGKKVVEHFDLIAGTSTGGIIAIGLAMGATAEQLLQFYTTEGPKMFPKATGLSGLLGRVQELFRPR